MNAARGEVTLTIDETPRALCLTLGALAELEALFECESMDGLQARLKTLSGREMHQVLRILLRACGNTCSVDGVSPLQAAKAIAEAFDAALG